MDALDAVVPLLAVAAPTAVVLREIVAYDRPRAAEPTVAESVVAEPVVAEPVVAPAVVEPVVAEPAVVEPAVVEPAVVEPAVVEPAVVEPAVVEPVVVEPVVAPDDDQPESMLSGLTTTEADERSWLRRVRALVVVFVLTMVTAALVGAGIYRAVSRLG